MAEAVAETLAAGDCLIAEAGPGAGKTAAYLVPLLLAGRRAVISTHSRNWPIARVWPRTPCYGEG